MGTAAALLLVLAAASVVDTTVAITANPVWTSSTSLIQSQAAQTSDDTLGELCVDDEGNFFSPHVSAANSKQDLLTLRGGSLCVDPDGNFYSPRLACPQAKSTAVTRGGCDGGSSIKNQKSNHKNIFQRRRNDRTTKKKEATSAAPKCAQSSATAALATGGYLKNDRLGGLCTDADGNLYGTPTTAFVAFPRR